MVAPVKPRPDTIATDIDPHHNRASRRAAALERRQFRQGNPRQHPAVVLHSHRLHVRGLLAVAMIAVIGLTAAVLILATKGLAS